MTVTVRLFAILRQRAGRDRIELERVAAGALPENGEEADGDLHARWLATS